MNKWYYFAGGVLVAYWFFSPNFFGRDRTPPSDDIQAYLPLDLPA